MKRPTLSRHNLLIVAAFFAVYIIWGSTYLGIRFALQSFPPFVLAGLRFLIAGLLLYSWQSKRLTEQPTLAHWRAACIIGTLLMVVSNGGLIWAEQTVDSGTVSLLVSIVPIWITLLDWLRPGGRAPTVATVAGLATGAFGVALLIAPSAMGGGKAPDAFGTACVILSTLSWSAGSIYSRYAKFPREPLISTAMQMICAGVISLVLAVLTGEFSKVTLLSATSKSLLSLGYLIVFGSIVSYPAYIWLLRVVSPARVATYAYVNPVVAVFLGFVFAGERLGPQTIIAALIILVAVALITNQQGHSDDPIAAQELADECPGPAAGAQPRAEQQSDTAEHELLLSTLKANPGNTE